MVRFLLSVAVFLASAAIGLLVAQLLVDEMSIDLSSFFLVVVICAVLQSVLAPFMARVAARNALGVKALRENRSGSTPVP